MENLHNRLKQTLAAGICEAISRSFEGKQIEQQVIYSGFSKTPSLKEGHIAFPVFPLAKELRQGPPQIAQKIFENLPEITLVSRVEQKGPYLNFFFHLDQAAQITINSVLNGDFFKLPIESEPKKKMFEYSQPNTHKELHVGHMRNLCLGNALVRLNQYLGHTVIPVTYPGDMGTHVSRCLWYLKYYNKVEAPEGDKGTWLGEVYSLATRQFAQLSAPEQENAKKQMAQILKEIDSKQGEFYDLWKQTRQWSIELFEKAYEWADVKFDRWYYESEVDAPSLERIHQLYEQGKLVKDDGAIGMDLSEDKLGFCLLVKSDGNGLYATKDIELAYQKFEEFHIDENLYVVDKRQAHHFQQVFKTLEKVGLPNAKNCHHLDYDFVELPSGAMSSREGNIIPLMELIHKMEEMIIEKYLNRNSEWSDEQKHSLATVIANGAIKYGMVRIDNNRKIVFDMDEWLKLDGETGPYLQYVHARISSVLEKFPYDKSAVDYAALKKEQEEALLIHLSAFNDFVYQAASNYKPSTLTAYLFDLGKLFNSFYAECPIGKADDEKVKVARLALAEATKKIIKQGLALLGIQAPKAM